VDCAFTQSPHQKGDSRLLPIPTARTEAPLVEPSANDDGRQRRIAVPGRPHLLKLGAVLQNRYRILDVLGVGGMSTVYKARDLRRSIAPARSRRCSTPPKR
jgi:hypothetical protein